MHGPCTPVLDTAGLPGYPPETEAIADVPTKRLGADTE